MFQIDSVINPQLDIDIDRLSFEDDAHQSAMTSGKEEQPVPSADERKKSKSTSRDERLARELGFDLSNIVHGPVVSVRRKMHYQAHAATTHSVAQATDVIDFLGRRFDSEDCLPFAVRVVEGGQLVAIAEDNGEFACGKVLLQSLQRAQDFNALVCVTRCVRGTFVADIVQNQKIHFVKQAADLAVEMLLNKLLKKDSEAAPEESKQPVDLPPIESPASSRKISSSSKSNKNTLPTIK